MRMGTHEFQPPGQKIGMEQVIRRKRAPEFPSGLGIKVINSGMGPAIRLPLNERKALVIQIRLNDIAYGL